MEKQKLQKAIQKAWNNSNLITDEHAQYKIKDLYNAGYPKDWIDSLECTSDACEFIGNYTLLGSIVSLFGIEVQQYLGHGTSSAEYYWQVKKRLDK